MNILILIIFLSISVVQSEDTLKIELSTLLKTIIDLARKDIHKDDQVAQYFKTDFVYIYGCIRETSLNENMQHFLGYNVRDKLQLSTEIMDYREEQSETQFGVGGGAHFTKKYVINVKPLAGLGRIQLDVHRLEGGGDDGKLVLASGRRVDCDTDFVSN